MSVGIFIGLLQYLPKNRAILVQKLGEEIIVKIRFRLFKDLTNKKNKNPMAIEPEGGGGEGAVFPNQR